MLNAKVLTETPRQAPNGYIRQSRRRVVRPRWWLTVVVDPVVDDEHPSVEPVILPVRVGVVGLDIHHRDHHDQLGFVFGQTQRGRKEKQHNHQTGQAIKYKTAIIRVKNRRTSGGKQAALEITATDEPAHDLNSKLPHRAMLLRLPPPPAHSSDKATTRSRCICRRGRFQDHGKGCLCSEYRRGWCSDYYAQGNTRSVVQPARCVST